mmetsp:Transcript_99201/g.175951  ORF Transcript_99201/g.175951 Transcript_99201/m.175951 type:complete len:593 (-) Transcript_99201:23-1801(-)
MGNDARKERCNDAIPTGEQGLPKSQQSSPGNPEDLGEFGDAADALMRSVSKDVKHSFIGSTTHEPSCDQTQDKASALLPKAPSPRPSFQIEASTERPMPRRRKVWRFPIGRGVKEANGAWVALWEDICNNGGAATDDQDALLSCQRWRRTKQGERHDVWFKIRHSDWERLTKSIRLGVPASLRRSVWYACSGAPAKKIEAGDGTYCDFVQQGRKLKGTEAARVIEADIPRTGVKGDNRRYLENVLLAFAAKNAQIGYCQSMNFIAATLLLYHTEEQVFWMLCSLIEDLLPEGYYTDSMVGLRVDLRVFDSLVAQYLPDLHRHFRKHEIDLSPITMNWFLCLFVNTLPADLSHRVMDCLLHEGSKVLFRAALSVLRLREKELKDAPSVMDAYFLLRVPFGVDSSKADPVPGAASAAAANGNLLDSVFGMWLKGFSSDRLQRLRKEHQAAIKAEDEEAAARRAELKAAAAQKSAAASAAAAATAAAEADKDNAESNIEALRRLSTSMINPPKLDGTSFGFTGRADDSFDDAKSWLVVVTGQSEFDVEESASCSETESEAAHCPQSGGNADSCRDACSEVQEITVDSMYFTGQAS